MLLRSKKGVVLASDQARLLPGPRQVQSLVAISSKAASDLESRLDSKRLMVPRSEEDGPILLATVNALASNLRKQRRAEERRSHPWIDWLRCTMIGLSWPSKQRSTHLRFSAADDDIFNQRHPQPL